jgi:hypothetical protein
MVKKSIVSSDNEKYSEIHDDLLYDVEHPSFELLFEYIKSFGYVITTDNYEFEYKVVWNLNENIVYFTNSENDIIQKINVDEYIKKINEGKEYNFTDPYESYQKNSKLIHFDLKIPNKIDVDVEILNNKGAWGFEYLGKKYLINNEIDSNYSHIKSLPQIYNLLQKLKMEMKYFPKEILILFNQKIK